MKRYGRTVALAGLDADIGPGITGLLGSNGAGKTTFISLALGLRSRDGGTLRVLGHDPAVAGIQMRARIGYSPEHHDLPSELAATDLVRHFAYAGLFVAAGFWFRRAIWWGLAFVLLWENAVAHLAEGSARFTVVGWASSVLATAPDVDVSLVAGSGAVAFVVLPVVALAGWLAATVRYRRADID